MNNEQAQDKNSESSKDKETRKVLYKVLIEEYKDIGILENEFDKTDCAYDEQIDGSQNVHEYKNRCDLRNIALKQLRNSIHRIQRDTPMFALCLSGGGIRSATFCLGILQSLAEQEWLNKIHYLSTVSGGGFIGSWLSNWVRLQQNTSSPEKEKSVVELQEKSIKGESDTLNSSNRAEGKPNLKKLLREVDEEKIKAVQTSLRFPYKRKTQVELLSVGKGISDNESIEVEAPEVAYLRTYSNYMSPQVGFFSTDTWTLIAIFLRNLLLNWTVIIPLIASALLLPRLLNSLLNLSDPLLPLRSFLLLLSNLMKSLGVDFSWLLSCIKWIVSWEFAAVIPAFLVGILGVVLVTLMRPGFQDFSFECLKQIYETDNIGVDKPINKVFFWGVMPFLCFAVLATFFLNRTRTVNHEIDFIHCCCLVGPILPIGYLIALACLWVKKRLPLETSLSFRKEFIRTLLNGLVSAVLLYVAFQLVALILIMFPVLGSTEFYTSFGVSLVLVVFLLSATFFTGITVKITSDDDREWIARFGAVILKITAGWLVISCAVIYGPRLFENEWTWMKTFSSGFAMLSGLFSLIAGYSNKTPAKDEIPKSNKNYLITIASMIAAPIFLVFLIILLVGLSDKLIEGINLPEGINKFVVEPLPLSTDFLARCNFNIIRESVWFLIFLIVGSLMGRLININKFSFHSTYRDRLIRAYLGAANKERLGQANSFTGLNIEKDNVEMKDLSSKPFHVVNMSLNLAKSRNLAWQSRKAEPFTATRLHCGSSSMGGTGNYRPSDRYGFNPQNKRAITLGTAAAISGAAVSPNMGYFTLGTPVSFLMVLFNIRLGWWLGNTGIRGDSSWEKASPDSSPKIFFDEAFGLTDDEHEYIYLSDGGHFENLGLYEMIVRRCKNIVVCDAGADPNYTFFDLGSAIHKIQEDLGIPIEFDEKPADKSPFSIAKIRYSAFDEGATEDDDGNLIYIKPTLTGEEPIDIFQYTKQSSTFPHETTVDQMYSETQFESYRKLGVLMMETVSKDPKIKKIFMMG